MIAKQTFLVLHLDFASSFARRKSFFLVVLLILMTGGQGLSADESLVDLHVVPAATGKQLVRVALPFAAGQLGAEQGIVVNDGEKKIPAAVRPLGWHHGALGANSIRVAMVTFPYEFTGRHAVTLPLYVGDIPVSTCGHEVAIERRDDAWRITFCDGTRLRLKPIWPDADDSTPWTEETVEANAYYQWRLWTQDIDDWQRSVEFRIDYLGQVIAVAHLQNKDRQRNWAPNFGWLVTEMEANSGDNPKSARLPEDTQLINRWMMLHSFSPGHSFSHLISRRRYRIDHPAAPLKRCGSVSMRDFAEGRLSYRYLRSTPHERVPMQPYSWRRAELVVSPANIPPPSPELVSPHQSTVDWKAWREAYQVSAPTELNHLPVLASAYAYHRQAVLDSVMTGHDWGNLAMHVHGQAHGDRFVMNRLNHAPAIFLEGLRNSDPELVSVALGWCDNFHDLTVWWGPKKTGGTRYPSLRLGDNDVPNDDTTFTWRGDESKTLCTKGYDAFQFAYEQTGDPRMKAACLAQTAYAAQHVHADRDQGECRNIGDVADFLRLYQLTGQSEHLDNAVRLFRELRTVLSSENLFSQDGRAIVDRSAYIDEDEMGKKYPFAKPYIIGYALAGCPKLAEYLRSSGTTEQDLETMIEAVADFLCESQDPLGGWRYPHPRSSRLLLNQAIEHAWQIIQAAKLVGPHKHYLDAVESVLRQRLWIWRVTGQIAGNLEGWEISTGKISQPLEIYSLYQTPDDRDSKRDYSAGNLITGSCPTEGIVYFPEVLDFYLQHRSAVRLLQPPSPESPLGIILARLGYPSKALELDTAGVSSPSSGVDQLLPSFSSSRLAAMEFPLAWENTSGLSFPHWRRIARQHVLESFLTPPQSAEFHDRIVDTEHRNGYSAHEIEFNLSRDSRVKAYLTVPEGEGPFPAVLLLHDHGAEFRIGKEKMIRPWNVKAEKLLLANQWAEKYYGGRFLGDELAQRGYVCLATDALNWSDRGGAGFDGQQALASNLMHLGMSLAGVIAWDDLRSVEYLRSRPEVVPERIAAMGLSMGSFRTWQLAAMTDHIAAGVAICWMGKVDTLQQPGNNQTKGHSAFTMLHPNLFNFLDYPDVASLACPKPMLFYNGRQDRLFPVAGVEQAYQKLHAVWHAQRREAVLETRIWDVPHEFNAHMQDAAFAWLEDQLKGL